MADVMSGIVSVSEVILISDDDESSEKNHKMSSTSGTRRGIKSELKEECVENAKEKENSLIVPIKMCEDQELLHRANYQVSPVLVKMTARANDVLKKFLTACQPLMRTENDCKILDSIRHDVQLANLHYLASDKFFDTVKFLAEMVIEDSKNVFVYIKELSDELRAYRDKCPKAKKTSVNGEVTQSSAHSGEEEKGSKGEASKQSRSKRVSSENETSSGVEHGRDAQSDQDSAKKENTIRKLTRHLQKLARAAKKLEEKEVDWDDTDDVNSPYLMESRIKAKAMKVWLKICELEERRPRTGRVMEKKLKYAGSKYPEINKSIETFVNKKRIFPDYTDVLGIVKSENEMSNLGLKDYQVQNIAAEVFRDVGQLLKERRQKDDYSLAMSRLAGADIEGEVKDPAEEDPELQAKLSENSVKANQKLVEVINSFVHKQMEMKLEPQEVQDENCNLSPPPSPKPGKEEGDNGDEGDEEEDETEDEADEAVLVPQHDGDDNTDDTTEGEDSAEVGNSEEASQADTLTEDSQSPLSEKTDALHTKEAVREDVAPASSEEHTNNQNICTVGSTHVQEKEVSVSVTSEGLHGIKTDCHEKDEETRARLQQEVTRSVENRREPEVIEIPSDDDDIITPPSKKLRL